MRKIIFPVPDFRNFGTKCGADSVNDILVAVASGKDDDRSLHLFPLHFNTELFYDSVHEKVIAHGGCLFSCGSGGFGLDPELDIFSHLYGLERGMPQRQKGMGHGFPLYVQDPVLKLDEYMNVVYHYCFSPEDDILSKFPDMPEYITKVLPEPVLVEPVLCVPVPETACVRGYFIGQEEVA